VGRNVDRFQLDLPVTAYLECALYMAALGYMAIRHRVSLSRWASAVFVGVHLVLFAYASGTSVSPRYLLPIYPALCLLAGHGLAELFASQRRGLRQLAALTLTTLIGIGLANNLRYVRPPVLTYDVLPRNAPSEIDLVNVESPAKTLDAMLELLRELRIQHVVCTSYLQWQLIFLSNEQVIASSAGLIPGQVRYPPYDRAVYDSSRVAMIFHKACDFNRRVQENPKWPQQFRQFEIGDFMVYVPLAEKRAEHAAPKED
jgi:hypothetical protein